MLNQNYKHSMYKQYFFYYVFLVWLPWKNFMALPLYNYLVRAAIFISSSIEFIVSGMLDIV